MREIYFMKCEECHHQGLQNKKKMGELFCQKCGLINEDEYSFQSIPEMMEKKHLEGMIEARKMNLKMMENLE